MSYRLQVEVVEARSLMPSDFTGWADPLASVTYSTKTKLGKTHYIKRTLNPVWKCSFQKTFDLSFDESITVQIMDHDPMSDDVLGQVTISLSTYSDNKWTDHWYRLMKVTEEGEFPARGYVRLRIQVVNPDQDTFRDGDRRPGDEVVEERHLFITSSTSPNSTEQLRSIQQQSQQVQTIPQPMSQPSETQDSNI